MAKVVTFGEIMLRLEPPGFERLAQARSFNIIFGGAEANVAASLAGFGEQVEFITCLPANPLGDACLGFLRQYNVGTSSILRAGERLGIYYTEKGAAQRGSVVVYDRAASSFSSLQAGMVDWKSALAGADWFHTTGISPSVSGGAADVTLEGARTARELGLTVSCDLNYRAKLWKWGKKASEVMPDLVSLCDLVIANEEDAEKVLGIKSPGTDVLSGQVEAGKYRFVSEEMTRQFPNLKTVAVTLRGSLSASHNTWSGCMLHAGQFIVGQQYDIFPIIDRVGGGDSFGAGLIYSFRHHPEDPGYSLRFAIAASCIKHSIPGDFNQVSVAEVEKLMSGDASGRVAR